MNEGQLLVAIVVLTICAIVVLMNYSDIINGQSVNHSARSAGAARTKRRAPAAPAIAGIQRSRRSRRRERVQQRSVRPSQEFNSVQRSNVQPERSTEDEEQPANTAPIITTKELTQLATAIALYQAGYTKQRSIETAWDCSKGAGAEWQRAKILWDMAGVKRVELPKEDAA